MVVPGTAPIPMFEPDTRVRVFEAPVTLRDVLKNEEALRVVTLVVERFETPVALRFVAKRPAAFITRALPLV